jgi:hypothetical protein
MKIKKGGQLSHVHQNGINNQKSLDYMNYTFFTPKQTKNISTSSSPWERERKLAEIKLRLSTSSVRNLILEDKDYSDRVFGRSIRDSDSDLYISVGGT